MASISDLAADGYPASAGYSISTDHVFDDDRDLTAFPRGEVGPPEFADPGEESENGRSRPVDSLP